MSVPPSRRTSSTPPAKGGRPDETEQREGKEFKLPPKKEQVEDKEEKPAKKGLFDIAAQEMTLQEKQQGLQQDVKAEAAKTTAVTGAQAAQQVTRIAQLIQNTVDTMHIGQIDAQTYASLNLKASAQIPPAFAGAKLKISYQENGITIRFDNFMTPQQQNTAITLVERNKEQLQDLVQALNSKNIQVTELTIGQHTVALPRVQPLPPPFQPTAAERPESEQQRERGGRQGREGEEGGAGGGPR